MTGIFLESICKICLPLSRLFWIKPHPTMNTFATTLTTTSINTNCVAGTKCSTITTTYTMKFYSSDLSYFETSKLWEQSLTSTVPIVWYKGTCDGPCRYVPCNLFLLASKLSLLRSPVGGRVFAAVVLKGFTTHQLLTFDSSCYIESVCQS